MDVGSKQISIVHEHPLIPFSRFAFSLCKFCNSYYDPYSYIYGGYRCNELGCEESVFHKECINPLLEINHSSHPDHSLKLIIQQDLEESVCSLCGENIKVGYCCSICDFKLDLKCAKIRDTDESDAAYHTSHPQHQLKSLEEGEVPDYADKKCLLCKEDFDQRYPHQLHHCDVCNFSICRACAENPPPVEVESLTTHEHQLHLVPRLIEFTCNACGELGDRSPYFCLQCNFLIHRQCIDLPRVININRHDHRISYTRRLGHGDWKCRVCRKKVDGFYGGYTCVKCPTFVVHSRCAIRDDVWDLRELEGMLEEEEIPPFEVIDENTIKHFSHDHNLIINKNDHGLLLLPESIVCEACSLQILSEPFYYCKDCDFILHEQCANHPRKKRHVCYNYPFTLQTDSREEVDKCWFCMQYFTGFRYTNSDGTIDVRCAAIIDTLEHESHQHPLYYIFSYDESCSQCENQPGARTYFFKCDECEYVLDSKCALFPKEIMKKRYDDHPLLLHYGDKDVDGEYWCEACETKVNPKGWFYTCYDCNTILHISCVVGDFSYIRPGSIFPSITTGSISKVVSNNSICRSVCFGCNFRCKLPVILKLSKGGVDTTGSQASVKIVKNKLAPPFRTAQFELEFGKGICNVTEIIDLSIKHKFITKNGTFFNLNGKNYHGKEALKRFLRQNEPDQEELMKKLQDKLIADEAADKESESESEEEEVVVSSDNTDDEATAPIVVAAAVVEA